MKLSIGIGVLAYNESSSIRQSLKSLLQQSLFTQANPNVDIEISVVPNGCTDDTAVIAKSILEDLITPSTYPQVRWQVCEVKQAGKSNAWNTYVHQIADPNAEYLFLMDADIELLEPSTLSSMVNLLEKSPDAWVAVDRPIKDVALKEHKNLVEKLSALVSNLSGNQSTEEGPAWLCGQLYCARACQLRQLWLPIGLPAEDGFLYTMIVTDGLQVSAIPQRVVLSKSASHVFQAYTRISRLLRHEKWLILGGTVNELIYKKFAGGTLQKQHVGSLIKELNEHDPDWLRKFVEQTAAEEGWWLISPFILTRRFQSLRHKPLGKAILLIPLAISAFVIDLMLALQANFELHQGSKLGYWGK
jgi:glycosyltransferase involved in cell wall biosynthesis